VAVLVGEQCFAMQDDNVEYRDHLRLKESSQQSKK